MTTCVHSWDKIYEQSLIAGQYLSQWQCSKCGMEIRIDKVPLTGLSGHESGKKILVGPHGGCGHCSDGSVYKRQILSADGLLTIERPQEEIS